MTILKSDVKLFKSQIITDADNAGGRMSGNELIDGEANNLFPDVSRLDRVYGRVNLRKIFAGVSTADQEPWLGAHAVVLAPPTNERVRALLFSTDSASDTRTNAKDRVEAYLAQGGDTGWLLYGKHYAGQRQMTWLLRTTDPLPQVGFTYVLLDNSGADSGTAAYIRVYDITVVERTFTTFENGAERTFRRNLVTVDIGTPLARDWDGNEALYFYNGVAIQTKVLNTTVADAARYYGIAPLAAPVDVSEEARQVELETVFEHLVPATRSESPMLDVRAAADALTYPQSGVTRTEQVTLPNIYPTTTETRTVYFPRGIVPGSMTLRVARSSFSGTSYELVRDDGNGAFVLVQNTSTSISVDLAASAVNYETGEVILKYFFNFSGERYITIIADPAAAYTDVSHSDYVGITQANRQFNYARNLLPLPTPRSLSVHYRALGVWYRLRDVNGNGQLVPDVAGTGSGTIDYQTGACLLTTAAYPDDGSAVIWQWGSGVSLKRRDGGDATFDRFGIEHDLTYAVAAGTLTVSFLSGGVTKTLTSTSEGVLSGSGGKGMVWQGNGHVVIEPSPLPDSNSQITFSYDRHAKIAETLAETAGAGVIDLQLTQFPVKAGSVVIRMPLRSSPTGSTQYFVTFSDDGVGNMRRMTSYNSSTGTPTYVTVGTVNYSTGAVSIDTTIVS